MRIVLVLLFSLPLLAQQADTGATAGESWLLGSMDVGYRWTSELGGNSDAYRSVVNLGDGPKLLGLDFTVNNSSRKLFDKMMVRANSWGGDPYNTAHLDAEKENIYEFSADYRNISYFNFLPSYADPTIGQGIYLNQRSFDMQRRLFDMELVLIPCQKIVPYAGYSKDWGDGRGITDFVSTANEYAVANRLRDKTDNYRAGVRLQLPRFHVTLEQGGTVFKDDQRVYTSDLNSGNRGWPYVGRELFLSGLEQAYGVRGDSIYSKVLLSANPASWVDLHGQFLYSRPRVDTNYFDEAEGLLAGRTPAGYVGFYTAQAAAIASEARQPHTSGSVGVELRPMNRLRIVESLMTDRYHVASSLSLLNQTSTNAVGSFTSSLLSGVGDLANMVMNYNRQEVNVLVDANSHVTLRGGYRYVWGDTQVRAPRFSASTTGASNAEMRQHVGLAGVNVRAGQKVSVNLDFESGSGDPTYFRTSVHDYQKIAARARYRMADSLTFTARASLLKNENPTAGIDYDFLSRQTSLGLFWTPGGGRLVTVLAEYTRSSLRSDIFYFVPQLIVAQERSFYRDNSHIATTVVDLNLPEMNQGIPKLSFGGSLFLSSGSRPSNYYQPLAKISVPVNRNVHFFTEWRWYGYSEPFYSYEGFRSHQLMAGLRFIR